MRPFILAAWFLCAGLILQSHPALAQTTAPADPPVSAAMAPTCIAIGNNLAMRIRLIREDISELTLDNSVRDRVNQVIDATDKEVHYLLTEMQAGRMPSNQRVMGIPEKLKQARLQMLDILGPEQAKRLTDKIESIRGEARYQLGDLQVLIDGLNLPDDLKTKSVAFFTQANSQVSKLPDAPVQGEEMVKNRDAMNRLLAGVHDQLAGLLSPDEQTRLGPHFARLAMQTPATQP